MNYNGENESGYDKKLDPLEIWRQYETARDYKSSEGLYSTISQNEAYHAGDQWRGVKSGNLPTPVFNFLEQLVDVKVSTLMAHQLTIHRSPDEISEFTQDAEVLEAVKVANLFDKKNWERLKLDNMNEDMLLDAALSGAGFSHWYWNPEIRTGNSFKTMGDIEGELVDSINLYVSNPNDSCIQDQDWIIISSRKTVKQVRAMAREAGVPDEQIDMI